jgi:rubrerythrin
VITKTKLGAGKFGRHREGRPGRVAERSDASTAPEPTRTASAQSNTTVRRRREAEAPQDQAVYTCQCGFVFQALVSTSVDCPHCGGTQAW